MAFLNSAANWLNTVLSPLDVAIVRQSRWEALRRLSLPPESVPSPRLDPIAAAYLKSENPRLRELATQYSSGLPEALRPTRWTSDYINKNIDLLNFRSDNAYVFGDRNIEATYALTAYYLETMDSMHLLQILEEDGMFGARRFGFRDSVLVSRDLLDSIVEIYSLSAQIPGGLMNASILDIGAGYGRLAHRLTNALTGVAHVYCADAIPLSTFLCEFYLKYRNVERASAVPLPDLESTLRSSEISVAVNIHSFSECAWSAIDWWISLLHKYRVRRLLIVPNPGDHGGTRLLTQESDGSNREYTSLLAARSYRLVKVLPKYGSNIIQHLGVTPTCHHYYELSD